MPTKLEWAALELQAADGHTTYTTDAPGTVDFIAWTDGKTVLCLLQYPPDVSAVVVKRYSDTAQAAFDTYLRGRKWQWLRIQFQEKVGSTIGH